jgi:hypothetical protein
MFGFCSGFGRRPRDKGTRTRRPRSFRAAIEVVEDRTLCTINSTLTAINWWDANGITPHNAVFGIGSDGGVYMNEDDAASWVDLGGYAKQICASIDAGNPEVYCIGGDNAVYVKHYSVSGHVWSGWSDLGGWLSQISATESNNVYGIGGDGAVYEYNSWWGWLKMGINAKQISAGLDAHGKPELFAVGSDNAVYVTDNGSSWHNLGGWVSQISAAADNTFFAIGGGGAVYVDSGSGFVNLGGDFQQISAGLDADGHPVVYGISVYAIGGDNEVWGNNDNGSGWYYMGLGLKEIAAPTFESSLNGYVAYGVGTTHAGYLNVGGGPFWNSLGGYLKLPGDPGTISAVSSSSGGMQPRVLGIVTDDGVSMNEDATGGVAPVGYVREVAAPAFDIGPSGDVAYAVGQHHGGYRYRPGFVSLGGYRQG